MLVFINCGAVRGLGGGKQEEWECGNFVSTKQLSPVVRDKMESEANFIK